MTGLCGHGSSGVLTACSAPVPGGFFFVDRPRGSYEASTTTEVETKLAFPLTGGETKYIRVSITPGFVAGHMQFELVNKSVAEAELASLNKV
jgi:hypothetical protein